MKGLARVAFAGGAASALLLMTPLITAAQGTIPITFTLTIQGPYSGADGFAVHIDLPITQQTRDLCVAPGTTGASVPVCTSGQTYTTVYQHSEWPTIPFWYERIHNGTVVQTFVHNSIFATRGAGFHATFTHAGAAPTPSTGAAIPRWDCYSPGSGSPWRRAR
jgi:hypothetical protein